MNDLIIGLSGHIDHGKTSFIKALNNFDGDQRSDEKERGMTIDLSFSNIILGKNRISFIDVPGHEKLVKNMISGAFGIDILILIIAANDGIMPQTIEHIHIARLLEKKEIIVFITKSDLANSSKIAALKNEIEKMLSDFHIIKIAEFSIYDNAKIAHTKEILANLKKPEIKPAQFFRYYIDRIFSKTGFGTIVTGTVLGGEINKNDKVFICELGKEVVVKNMHNHDLPRENATSAQRIALNLNISQDYLKKGMQLSKKGILRGFNRIDCVIFAIEKLNPNALFFIGSKRVNARINILKDCGDKIFASVILNEPIFAVFGDNFILRDNAKTIGGGRILNPISDPMKKAQKIAYLQYLFENDLKNAFKILLEVHKCGFGMLQALQRFNTTPQAALEIAGKIDGNFIDGEQFIAYNLESKKLIKDSILRLISKNNNAIFSANSINLELKWASPNFISEILLELSSQNIIKKSEDNLFLSANSDVSDVFSYAKDLIINELQSARYTPEAPYNIYDKFNLDRKLGDNIFKNLTKAHKIVRLSHNLFVWQEHLEALIIELKNIIKTRGFIDIDEFKAHFDMSRKYLIAYLDYLDLDREILRVENKRYLRSNPPK